MNCEDYHTVFLYTLHGINIIVLNLFCHIAGSFATEGLIVARNEHCSSLFRRINFQRKRHMPYVNDQINIHKSVKPNRS